MLFHAYWVFYTVKELDSHGKHGQSFKNKVVRLKEHFCGKNTPSGLSQVSESFFRVWACVTSDGAEFPYLGPKGTSIEMVLTAEHKIRGEESDKIQLLPPYIPKPTNLHPLYKIRLLPPDLVYCIEVLLQISACNTDCSHSFLKHEFCLVVWNVIC